MRYTSPAWKSLWSLHRFVRDHGPVTFIDNQKQTRILKDGSPDSWDLALKADSFRHVGKAYTRN